MKRRAPKPRAETDKQWLSRLADEWPEINLLEELRKAHKKRAGDVERGWFESVWLPGVTPQAPKPGEVRVALAPAPVPEPEGWREVLAGLYPQNIYSGDDSARWTAVPPAIRAEVEQELRANVEIRKTGT